MIFDSLLKIIDKKLSSGVSQSEGLQYICQVLFDHIEHYDWVGYYLNNQEKKELFFFLIIQIITHPVVVFNVIKEDLTDIL